MDQETAGDRARARLKKENESKVATRRAKRGKGKVTKTATAPKRRAPAPKEFEVCHVTAVLRRKVGRGYQYHRVAIQVGCGTHLGDIKLDYVPVATPAARDLPQRAGVFGRDLAKIIAYELARRAER